MRWILKVTVLPLLAAGLCAAATATDALNDRGTQPEWTSPGVNLPSVSEVSVTADQPRLTDLASDGQSSASFSAALCDRNVPPPVTPECPGGGSVPEPQTFTMFGVGLALVGVAVLLRKRTAVAAKVTQRHTQPGRPAGKADC